MIARTWKALLALPRVETIVLVAAIVLLVFIGVARDRTRQVGRVDSYSTYDAAAGGYRAYYELLEREGMRVDRFRSRPAFLDGSLDTLIWAEPLPFDPAQGESTPADARALEAWVRAGGRLVYIGHDDAAAKQGLLHLPASRARAKRARPAVVDASLRAAGVSSVFSTASLRWRVAAHGVRVLFDDGRGPLVVRYAFGRGTVVAAIDETLFANREIARGDRARLAVALASQARATGTLAFDEAVHGFASPHHWWSVVPRPFVIALAIALVALLLAFAGAAVRLGPPIVPPRRDDRSSGEFIDGLASLLERGGAAGSALDEALSSTSRVAARALGLRDGVTNDEIARRIASDETRAAYRELVKVATNAASDANLVRGAALAQRVRKEFVTHARD
jgi:hypothetical protein